MESKLINSLLIEMNDCFHIFVNRYLYNENYLRARKNNCRVREKHGILKVIKCVLCYFSIMFNLLVVDIATVLSICKQRKIRELGKVKVIR